VSAKIPRWVIGGGLVVWVGLSFVVQTTLMAGHWYTLPTPAQDVRLERALRAVVSQGASDTWATVHVLYSECRCSQRVFDHLFESPRPDDLHDVVLLVGADPEIERRAANAGFAVRVLEPQQLESEFGVVSAPLLFVLGPDARLRYAGGYTERKQGYDVLDLEILQALKDGREPTELPLYGCGVSKELQQILDPMGLK